MKRITIDPITRLEGHGKIEIFLNDKGEVANTYFQVPELRGFEKFTEGRMADDMPQITQRICGVCPEAHHLASTKALDALYHVDPPATGEKAPRASLQRFLCHRPYHAFLHSGRSGLCHGAGCTGSGT